MRLVAAVCLVALGFVAGCSGGDDRPDLAAPPPTTERANPASAPTQATDTTSHSVTTRSFGAPVQRRDRKGIAEQARAATAAVHRWNSALDSCVGPSGKSDDAGAICTREAWEQLFDQMYAVQYELLALSDRIGSGVCRGALAPAIDAAHGFLGGATPLNVVWLDDQQQPPSVYDLKSIVDIARPLPARLHEAAAACARRR